MSTNEDKYVTKEYLEAFMGAALQANNEMQEQQRKNEFVSLMAGIENKLAPLVGQVNEITAALNLAQQQVQQQNPPAAVQQQKLSMPDLVNLFREGASAYKEVKSATSGESSELDKWGSAFAEIARREALGAMKLNVRRALRKGVVDSTTIENIVGETIERAAGTHEPIL